MASMVINECGLWENVVTTINSASSTFKTTAQRRMRVYQCGKPQDWGPCAVTNTGISHNHASPLGLLQLLMLCNQYLELQF